MWSRLFAKTAKVPALDLQTMDIGLTPEVSRVLAGASVPTFRRALPAMSAEMDRARRYDRPVALALIADARRTHGDGLAASGLITAVIASVLRDVVRETDIVTYAATLGRCLLMMPEIHAVEARRALCRVGDLCASRLMFPIRGGLSTFPYDGWTLEELIRHAGEMEDEARPVALEVPSPNGVIA